MAKYIVANINFSIMEKRKLNILFIANEYPLNKGTEYNAYGGQASYLQNISNLIKKKNHNVTVFLISNRTYNSAQNGIKIREFGFKISFPFLKKISNFLNYVFVSFYMNLIIFLENKKKNFDIVQYPSFLPLGIILIIPKNCKKICRISGITKLWRNYNNNNKNIFHLFSDFVEKKRVLKAQKVFAPSKIISKKASLEYLRKVYTLRSPLVNINRKILKSSKKLPKENFFLYIGTLNRVKGIDLLANAFLKVFKKYKNISLVIIGRNEKIGNKIESINYFFKKCKKFKSKIKYFGVLSKKEIFYFYTKAEAIIIPSRLDNYPNVMIESISFKKPIIGFLNSSLDEVINDGKTGFLANKQNLKSLFKKIDEFLCQSRTKKEIIKKNILKLNKKLKSIDYAEKLIDFYNQN